MTLKQLCVPEKFSPLFKNLINVITVLSKLSSMVVDLRLESLNKILSFGLFWTVFVVSPTMKITIISPNGVPKL